MTVEVPEPGYLILPITAFLFVRRPAWLLPWTALMAVFQAASVLNVNLNGYAMGLQPGYCAALAFVGRFAYDAVRERRIPGPYRVYALYAPLFLFAAYAAISALVLPRLFEGAVMVYPPREGLRVGSLSPLEPVGTNLSQTLYILFLSVFSLCTAVSLTSVTNVRTVVRVCLIGGILVSVIGFYQITAWYLDLPYPHGWLNSNPGYAQGYMQVLGGVKRLSSTVVEPSVAGYYLAGFFALSLTLYLLRPVKSLVAAAVPATFAALVLTTSTTAYATLAVIMGALLLYGLAQPALRRRILLVVGACLLAAAAGVLLLWLLGRGEAVLTVVDRSLLEKASSLSFQERAATMRQSVEVLGPTWGSGVGWGSNRSSSLLTTVVSNAGLWGSFLLLWFAVRVTALVAKTARFPSTPTESRTMLYALAASVLAMLVAAAIAVPDLTHVIFWIALSTLIGLAVATQTPGNARHEAAP